MSILMSAFVCFDGTGSLSTMTGGALQADMVAPVIPYVIAGILSMCCTTAVALSMEGRSVWIVKSLPVSPQVVYDSKIMVCLTITVPSAFISGILIRIGMPMGILDTLLLFLLPVAFSIWTAVFGVFVNNRFCNYEWESETRLVKQSTASFIGIFAGMVLAMILGTTSQLVSPNKQLNSVVVFVLLLTASFFLYRNEVKKPLR